MSLRSWTPTRVARCCTGGVDPAVSRDQLHLEYARRPVPGARFVLAFAIGGNMNTRRRLWALPCLGLLACGPGGGTTSTSTSLESSRLTSEQARMEQPAAGLNAATAPCPSGAITCVTPTAFSGTFDSLNFQLAPGDGDYVLLNVIASDGTARPFDLARPEAIEGSASCCDGREWDSNQGYYAALMWTVSRIDTSIDGDSLGFSGTYTFRLSFADDATTGARKGDVLLQDGEDFKWCPQGAVDVSECVSERPENPITQDPAIVAYTPPEEGPDFPYLAAALFPDATGNGKSTVGSDDLLGQALAYTVDFDLTDALAVPDPDRTFGNVFEVMPVLFFRGFSAQPTGQTVAGGISAVLTVETL